MSPKIPLLLTLLGGMVACDRQLAPPDTHSPVLSWMNNPYNGNLRITRFEDAFIVCWSDATNGLRACHSTIPLGDGTETDCGPQAELDPVQIQLVGLINEADLFASWLHQNAKGTLWITVRDLNQAGECFGNRLVAEGYGTLHNNDNDLFGAGPGDNNANAWRFAAQGQLATPQGGRVVYEGHNNFMFSNAAGFKELSASVQVH
jgi:hypothetical protein